MHDQLDPDEAQIVGTVHGSILTEVRNDVLLQITQFIKTTMEDMSIVKRKFGTEVDVPIIGWTSRSAPAGANRRTRS